METINCVVNCCRGGKGRKLLWVKEKSNKGHIVPSGQESWDEPGPVCPLKMSLNGVRCEDDVAMVTTVCQGWFWARSVEEKTAWTRI